MNSETNMKDKPTEDYTINTQTGYTVLFKEKDYSWTSKEKDKIKYYSTLKMAEDTIREVFHDEDLCPYVEEAHIFEWKKTLIAVKKNNKQSIESTACCYDVEQHYDTCPNDLKPLWRPWRSNFETLKEAQNYIKWISSKNPEERYRIVMRQMTTKHSVVE
jgi:hypothetical protein